jgi:hypothetical protein
MENGEDILTQKTFRERERERERGVGVGSNTDKYSIIDYTCIINMEKENS